MSEWNPDLPGAAVGWPTESQEPQDLSDMAIVRTDEGATRPPWTEPSIPIVASEHRQPHSQERETEPGTSAPEVLDTGSARVHAAPLEAKGEPVAQMPPREAPESREAARQRERATDDFREWRTEIEQTSAATYNRAVLAAPDRLVDIAHAAMDKGNVYKATTCAMALYERGETDQLRKVWPRVAPEAIDAAHARIGDIAAGAADMSEVLLVQNLDPNSFRTTVWREKSRDLKAALREASLGYYDLAGAPEPEGVSGAALVQEDAIRAGFIHERLRIAGPPKLRNEHQVQLFDQLDTARDKKLWNACLRADINALPDRIAGELSRIARQYASQQEAGGRTEKIRDFLGHTVDYFIKHGLTDITRHGWRR